MTLKEIFMDGSKIQSYAFDKSLEDDFYLGVQTAYERILAQMGQIESLKNDKEVKAVLENLKHSHPALR